MTQLTHADLLSLEDYSLQREAFRAGVINHKKHRRVAIGPHAALYFEDAITVQYQVQEMLRIERIFEHQGIQDELDVYNPLIPDGSNWKATFMMEYPDVEQRRQMLAKLLGVEKALYVRVEGYPLIRPIANEDLDRQTDEKTSAVHFVRFELGADRVDAVKQGATISVGIDHPAYQQECVIAGECRASLLGDLD